jgi:WD40 repeat protein
LTTLTAPNPYVGPRTFERKDAARFFGRETEARDLLALAGSQRLVLFYAQSGAGKSSLINTRLAPQLEARGLYVLPVGRVGGELPAGVTAVENIYLFNLMLSLDQGRDGRGGDPARLVGLTLGEFLHGLTSDDGQTWYYDPAVAADVAEAGVDDDYTAANTVLIVDQFEEIITTHADRWPERAGFFQQLDAAMQADPRLRVVLSLREDYVAALDPYAQFLADKLRARFYMERMGVEAALLAVQQPAADAGRPFAPGVAAQLVDDLRKVRVPGQAEPQVGQNVEPVQLQVVCYQLWENLQRPSGDLPASPEASRKVADAITLADLQAAGDVDSALAAFYETAIAQVVNRPELGVSEQQLRTWFSTKLITEAGTRGTVFRDERSGLTAGLPTAAVEVLARQFLLRTELRAGGAWVELVHDRFVAPILRANRARQTPLALDAEAWLAAGRDASRLYEGQKLKDAAAAIDHHPEQHGEAERAFVDAGQARQAARDARWRRIATWATVGLVLLFGVLASLALWNAVQANQAAQQAEKSRKTAEAKATEAAIAEATAMAAEQKAVSERVAADKARKDAENQRSIAVMEGARADKEARAARSAQLALHAKILPQGQETQSLLLLVEALSIDGYSPIAVSTLVDMLQRFRERSLTVTGAGRQVQISPDGNWLAAIDDDPGTLVWSTDALNSPIRIGAPTNDTSNDTRQPISTTHIQFSNDSRALVTVNSDGAAALWDTSSLRTDPISTSLEVFGAIAHASFTPDSRQLVALNNDVGILLIPVGYPMNITESQTIPVTDVTTFDVSQDGAWLATGASEGSIYLWNLETLTRSSITQPLVLTDYEGPVRRVAFSGNGKWLAATRDDEVVRVWSLGTQMGAPMLLRPQEEQAEISSFAFTNPEGTLLAIADTQGAVSIWDLTEPSSEPKHRLQCGSSITDIEFSQNGRWLAAANEPHRNLRPVVQVICMWNAGDFGEPIFLPIVLSDPREKITDIEFNSDGALLVSTGADGAVRVWSIDQNTSFPQPVDRFEGGAEWAVTSPNGRWLAVSTTGGEVVLYDPQTLQRIVDLPGHVGQVSALAFISDSTQLATGDREGTIRIWNLDTNPPTSSTISTGRGQVWGLAFSPDQRWLAGAFASGTGMVLDLALETRPAIHLTRDPIPSTDNPTGEWFSVAFSPDSQLLAVGGGDAIGIWKTSNLDGPPNDVLPMRAQWVEFSGDGQQLAAASSTNVLLWKVDKLSAKPIELSSPAGSPLTVAFSPDSQRIAASHWEGAAVSLWNSNALDDDPVVLQGTGSGRANSARFSSDGRKLIVADSDGAIRIWPIAAEDLVRRACDAARRNFTMSEWKNYNKGRPYHLTCEQQWPPHPSAIESLIDDARSLAEDGDIPAAIAKFEEALALDADLGVEPRVEANRIYAQVLVGQGRGLAQAGDAANAITQFEEALALDPDLDIDPEREAGQIAAPVLIVQGRTLAQQGDVAGATAKFEAALALDPSLPIEPALLAQIEWGNELLASGAYTEGLAALSVAQTISPTFDITNTLPARNRVGAPYYRAVWNTVCWNGSLDGAAAAVMPACERAVALAPADGWIRDSRGLARALTGDLEGATEDFEFAVQWAEETGYDPAFIESRTAWIEALRAGENPFDAATLEQLRNE